MIDIRPLTGIGFDQIARAFDEAFSDYVIKLNVTTDGIRDMLTRRGYVPERSVGAFDDDGRMVGFTCNCIDGERAYDSGTGVVPSHRRGGLARRLMEASFAAVAPAREYVLEVIEQNERAAALYRSLGFIETRRLQCWTFDVPETRSKFTELANVDFGELASWCDVEPSWQNSIASIRRSQQPHVVLGDDRCAIVFFPWTGDVPLLAVRPPARRQGLGRALLHAAATRAARPLRIINIDERDTRIAAFLDAVGAKRTVRQLEMRRALDGVTI